MLRFSLYLVAGAAALAIVPTSAAPQQSGVSLSPFVAFLPTGSASPMAGLSLSIAGGPLALRAGGHMSLEERGTATTAAVTTRPWGADADALAYLDGYHYGNRVVLTPYVFAGVSTSSIDSAAFRLMRQGWSYGAGVTLPMGRAFALVGEARWRMSEFVLPNATSAPPVAREFRIGASFRVGSGGTASDVVRVVAETEGVSGADWDPDTPSSSAARLLSTASEYIGTPYRRGGVSPSSGFDASGFVRFVFSMLGVNLPRTSSDQARVGQPVRTDWRAIAPGDLVMFEDDGGISHVAIYVGRGRIIHSSETGGGVRYDDLTTDRGRWFFDHLAAARRVTPNMRGMLIDLARGFASTGNNSDRPDRAPKASSMRRKN